MKNDPIIKVEDLKVHFGLTKGIARKRIGTVKAVDGAPKVLACVDRPITASEKKMGSDSRKEDRIYTRIKAAPPFSPTI